MVLSQRPIGGLSSNLSDRNATEAFASRQQERYSPSSSDGSLLQGKHAGTTPSNFDLKLVHFIHNILHQATDPKVGIPMLMASPVYNLGKAALLKSFLAKPAATWLGRRLTLNILPVLGGFGAETVAFGLSSRALTHYLKGPIPWDPASIAKDTWMTGMTLALLKGIGFAGRKGMQWYRGLDEFKPQLWNQTDRRAMFWTGQVSGYLGLVASHGLQGKLFSEFHHSQGNIWIDSLGAHIALGLGASGGRRLLGPEFHTWEKNLAHRAHRLSQEVQFPFTRLGNSQTALAAGAADFAAEENLSPQNFFNKRRNESDRASGRFASTPPKSSNPRIKDPIWSILEAVRGESASETLKDYFSEFQEKELLDFIEQELRNLQGLSMREKKVLQMRFLTDPPKSIHGIGQELGRSHEWARWVTFKIRDRIVVRLLHRLNKEETAHHVPIEGLIVSHRAKTFFADTKIKTFGELVHFTESDILKTVNAGVQSVKELKKQLAEWGLSLREPFRGEAHLKEIIQEALTGIPSSKTLNIFISSLTGSKLKSLITAQLNKIKFSPETLEILEKRFFSDPPWELAKIAEHEKIGVDECRTIIQNTLQDILRSVDQKLSIPVYKVLFPTRIMNLMDAQNVETLGEMMIWWSEKDLLAKKNMGKISVEETKEIMAKMGLPLSED